MSNFKRFSILSLTLLLVLTLSGCFYARGFNGGYHQRNSHYNSYKGSYDRGYHGNDHHKNDNRKYYRR